MIVFSVKRGAFFFPFFFCLFSVYISFFRVSERFLLLNSLASGYLLFLLFIVCVFICTKGRLFGFHLFDFPGNEGKNYLTGNGVR